MRRTCDLPASVARLIRNSAGNWARVVVVFLVTLPAAATLAQPTVTGEPAGKSSIQVKDLKTEHLSEPLGVDIAQPRFRWLLESVERGQLQTAYQVLVASTPEKLQTDTADRWDSGKVVSDNSAEVLYAGQVLSSGERVYWKVRVWDRQNQASAYSDPAFFEMGLLHPSDWHGHWIAGKQGVSSPLFRREFSIDAVVRRARIYVSGLGYYELTINGRKIGDRVLEPASTYYNNDQPFKLGSRVLYSTYDVTADLKNGANALGVMLGNGWYSAEAERLTPGSRDPYGDRPCLILQLDVEFDDGRRTSVVSNGTWKSASGPITYNDLADGERYDARLEILGWNTAGFDDTAWAPVSPIKAPSGKLSSELLPPTRVIETRAVSRELIPKGPSFWFGEVKTYDFGQNFTGWAQVAVHGPRGATLQLRYSPRIYTEDQTLDIRSSSETPDGGAKQTDTYVLKGDGTEVWEPRFTVHGFRYLESRDLSEGIVIKHVDGRVVHEALVPVGHFSSSNALLNRIHENVLWTLRSNFQGIPQDAAERAERGAWLGDPGFTALDHLYNYDMEGFWEKWLADIQDSQKENGSIPWASPLHVRGTPYTAWPTWQSTYPILVWNLYEFYGDRRVLEQHYSSLKKLADFLSIVAGGDLIGGEFLGDHMEPQADGVTSMMSLHTPSALTANAYYFSNVLTVARIAEVLGKKVEAREYFRRAARISAAFNRSFFHPETNQYATGSQSSNALALQLGLVPEKMIAVVVKNLVDDIRQHQTHVTTGVVGTSALVDALPKYGAASALYDLVVQTSYPSLGDQVAKGATTVCETYECNPWNSQNMKMFTSWDRFFYRDLAGIRPLSPGYRRVLIRPQPVGDLQSVSASQQTVRGAVSVDWIKANTSFDLKVSIPAGIEADIAVPTLGLANVQITEGVATVWKANTYLPGAPGLLGARADTDSIIIRAGSGSYHFALTGGGG
jgi:alpha-L-rhamnosidase